ncbi:hypothetical protein [Caballeronia choica]|uniref:hypothetical protein n=1 Tax=Caballeronia choica TaxID=326476 RepID=UPI000F7391BB|nr:hypothetical protein [Caballeronia choica]
MADNLTPSDFGPIGGGTQAHKDVAFPEYQVVIRAKKTHNQYRQTKKSVASPGFILALEPASCIVMLDWLTNTGIFALRFDWESPFDFRGLGTAAVVRRGVRAGSKRFRQ